MKWITNLSVPLIYLGLGITFFFIHCESPNTYSQGERLYNIYCKNCHMADGSGLGRLIPPLKSSDYIDNNEDILPCIIKYGLTDTIVVNGKFYSEPMPANPELKNSEIANILNFINSEYSNILDYYSESRVKKLLKKCSD